MRHVYPRLFSSICGTDHMWPHLRPRYIDDCWFPAPADSLEIPESIGLIENVYNISHQQSRVPPGIYFLCVKTELVYIGQSLDPVRRIRHHAKVKDFDRVFYIERPEDELNAIEGALIRLLAPRLNEIRFPKVSYSVMEQIATTMICPRTNKLVLTAINRPSKTQSPNQLSLLW